MTRVTCRLLLATPDLNHQHLNSSSENVETIKLKIFFLLIVLKMTLQNSQNKIVDHYNRSPPSAAPSKTAETTMKLGEKKWLPFAHFPIFLVLFYRGAHHCRVLFYSTTRSGSQSPLPQTVMKLGSGYHELAVAEIEDLCCTLKKQYEPE